MRINKGEGMSRKARTLSSLRAILTDLWGDESMATGIVDGLGKAPSASLGALNVVLSTVAGQLRVAQKESAALKNDAFNQEAIKAYLDQVRTIAYPWKKEYGLFIRETPQGQRVGIIDPTLGGYVSVRRDLVGATQFGWEANDKVAGKGGSWQSSRNIAGSLEEAKRRVDENLQRFGITLLEDPVEVTV
jgi:hypothetical protein